MALVLLLAETAEPAPTGGFGSLGLIVVFFIAMYFLLIRPQQKRQKEQQQLLSKLEAGMDVVTIGGLHGHVVDVADTTVDLQVDEDGSVLRFERNAVRSIESGLPEAEDDAAEDAVDAEDSDE